MSARSFGGAVTTGTINRGPSSQIPTNRATTPLGSQMRGPVGGGRPAESYRGRGGSYRGGYRPYHPFWRVFWILLIIIIIMVIITIIILAAIARRKKNNNPAVKSGY